MPVRSEDVYKQFERGVVMLSLDTEQIWGYVDLFEESQFRRRYPDAIEAHTKLLACLAKAGVSATWFVVGGMALHESKGRWDPRMAGLLPEWTNRIAGGTEETAPLWYRKAFVESLRQAWPFQEIGLHGGLTHLIWTNPNVTREVAEWELTEGIKALTGAQARPISFSFTREQEAYYDLLPEHGIRCFRGRTVLRSFQMGRTLSGALARLYDEIRHVTPIPVWPREILPGFWEIPSSLFLYPISVSRTRVVGLRSRIERFSRGLEAAVRHRGIFHYCLHPENLTESPQGFAMFEEILERLLLSRDRGDIEILTMSEVAGRMEMAREAESSQASVSRFELAH
jgi:peptidoglycan/xylan/chitin deacetylase (PgdA/CDA1 family)